MDDEKLSWLLPIITVSEANTKEHWSKSSKRHTNQQRSLRILLPKTGYPLPCIVTLTRTGGRKLDSADNLRICFKWIIDELSDIICGNVYQKGLNLTQKRLKGRNDSTDTIEWRFDQEGGKFKGIRIQIEKKILLDHEHNENVKQDQ